MIRLLRTPRVWLAALLAWAALLWVLSSISGSSQPLPVDHLDKLAHFGYFLGGGLLFAGWRFQVRPDAKWRTILILTVLAMATIGVLDEWHQCFTPGRSGLDPGDWLADLLGGTAGAFAAKFMHHRLRLGRCPES